MERKTLDSILKNIFTDEKIPDFSKNWISKTPTADKKSIKENYETLRGRFTKEEIKKHAHLLARKNDLIKSVFKAIDETGLKISTKNGLASLAGSTSEKITENARYLQLEVGMNKKQIEQNAPLLGWKTQTLISRKESLSQMLGLSNKQIAKNGRILTYDPEDLVKRYNENIKSMKKIYPNKEKIEYILKNNAGFLLYNPKTVRSNVGIAEYIGIDEPNTNFYETTPLTKRKKILWTLNEICGYRHLSKDGKKEAISNVYKFIKENPTNLKKSINQLKKEKPYLEKEILGETKQNS